eukprot:jgi/Botrbrau1/274/Bobra.0022s0243.1
MTASWAAIARAAPAPAEPAAATQINSIAGETVVLDANVLISGAPLSLALTERVVTIPEVLEEVRDKQARQALGALPYNIATMDPSDESLSTVMKFARATGELHSLSKVDIKLLALVHTLEVAVRGSDHLPSEPAAPQLHSKEPKGSKGRLPGWGDSSSHWAELDNIADPDAGRGAGSRIRDQAVPLEGDLHGSTDLEYGHSPERWGQASGSMELPGHPHPQSDRVVQGGPPHTGGALVGAVAPGRNVEDEAAALGNIGNENALPGNAAAGGSTEAGDVGAGGDGGEVETREDSEGEDWEVAARSHMAARRRRRKVLRQAAAPAPVSGGQSASGGASLAAHAATNPAARHGAGEEHGAGLARGDGEGPSLHGAKQGGVQLEEMVEEEEEVGFAPVSAPSQELGKGQRGSGKGAAGYEAEADAERRAGAEEGEGKEVEKEEEEEGKEEAEKGSSGSGGGRCEGGLFEEEEDDGGWTSNGTSDVGDTEEEEEEGEEQGQRSSVVCVTGDRAMQNVLLQMGLELRAPDGQHVTSVRSFVLRCTACTRTTHEAGRLFCERCGNATLEKVELVVGPAGAAHYGVRKKHVLKGTRFSLPKPKGGKNAGNPILREDQLLLARRRGGAHARRGAAGPDAFAPEYGPDTWFRGGTQQGPAHSKGKAALLTGWQNNPNERKNVRTNRRG